MALTGQELKSHLWRSAEILRGSAVDRTDWKAYILPLLFFKRVSDVWDEETADAVELYEGPRQRFMRPAAWKAVRYAHRALSRASRT